MEEVTLQDKHCSRKYTPEQVQELIDKYFERRPSKVRDDDGDVIKDVYDMKPPTYTGLIRETIGRACWENYKKDPLYKDILEDAESRVEEWHEARLSSSGCTGSMFWLKNRGKNWREDTNFDPRPSVVVAMSLDKADEELYKKNMGAFFGTKSE